MHNKLLPIDSKHKKLRYPSKPTTITKQDLKSRFYYENAAKSHKDEQGRYWALEMGPTPRTTASQEIFRAGAKLDPSLLIKK